MEDGHAAIAGDPETGLDLAQIGASVLGVGITLHHVRSRLPATVRVTAAEHPLGGQSLWARHVYRRYGRIWVVVVLPDGGVTSVPVESTDVVEAEPTPMAVAGNATLSVAGVRRLAALVSVHLERLGEGSSVGAGPARRNSR